MSYNQPPPNPYGQQPQGGGYGQPGQPQQGGGYGQPQQGGYGQPPAASPGTATRSRPRRPQAPVRAAAGLRPAAAVRPGPAAGLRLPAAAPAGRRQADRRSSSASWWRWSRSARASSSSPRAAAAARLARQRRQEVQAHHAGHGRHGLQEERRLRQRRRSTDRAGHAGLADARRAGPDAGRVRLHRRAPAPPRRCCSFSGVYGTIKDPEKVVDGMFAKVAQAGEPGRAAPDGKAELIGSPQSVTPAGLEGRRHEVPERQGHADRLGAGIKSFTIAGLRVGDYSTAAW